MKNFDETLTINQFTFRIKPMNAIDALSFKVIANLRDFATTQAFFNTVLENVEVATADQWLAVKTKGRNTYYPAGIEDDGDMISQLIDFFVKNFATPFFKNTDESAQF